MNAISINLGYTVFQVFYHPERPKRFFLPSLQNLFLGLTHRKLILDNLTSLKNQLQKHELAIIYQNKHNFGHTEAGLRESCAMSIILGMLHAQQN